MKAIRSIEKKNKKNSRLTIPPELRRMLGNKVVITRGSKKNLRLYPQAEWEQLVKDQKNRRSQRLMTSQSMEQEFDMRGGILIPNYLQEYASLRKMAVIITKDNKVEIWNEEKVTEQG